MVLDLGTLPDKIARGLSELAPGNRGFAARNVLEWLDNPVFEMAGGVATGKAHALADVGLFAVDVAKAWDADGLDGFWSEITTQGAQRFGGQGVGGHLFGPDTGFGAVGKQLGEPMNDYVAVANRLYTGMFGDSLASLGITMNAWYHVLTGNMDREEANRYVLELQSRRFGHDVSEAEAIVRVLPFGSLARAAFLDEEGFTDLGADMRGEGDPAAQGGRIWSPGQMLAMGLSNVDLRDDRQLLAFTGTNAWKYIGGFFDAAARLTLDPDIVAGKAASVARVRHIVRPFKSLDDVHKAFAEGSYWSRKILPDLAEMRSSQVYAKYLKDHVDGAEIAHLLKDAHVQGGDEAATQLMRAFSGDTHAVERLDELNLSTIEKVQRLVDERKSIISRFDERPTLVAADGTPVVMRDVNRVERLNVQERLEQIGQSVEDLYADGLKQERIRNLYGTITQESDFANRGIKGARRQFAYNRIYNDTWQSGPMSRVVRATSLFDKMPHSFLRLDDASSVEQLRRQLREAGIRDDSLVQRYLAADTALGRSAVYDEAEGVIFRTIAREAGMTDEMMEQALEQIRVVRNQKQGILKNRVYDGEGRGWLKWTDEHGADHEVALPLHLTQEANVLHMVNVKDLKLAASRWRDLRVNMPVEATVNLLDLWTNIWKTSTLLRPAWATRTILLDEEFRALAKVAAIARHFGEDAGAAQLRFVGNQVRRGVPNLVRAQLKQGKVVGKIAEKFGEARLPVMKARPMVVPPQMPRGVDEVLAQMRNLPNSGGLVRDIKMSKRADDTIWYADPDSLDWLRAEPLDRLQSIGAIEVVDEFGNNVNLRRGGYLRLEFITDRPWPDVASDLAGRLRDDWRNINRRVVDSDDGGSLDDYIDYSADVFATINYLEQRLREGDVYGAWEWVKDLPAALREAAEGWISDPQFLPNRWTYPDFKINKLWSQDEIERYVHTGLLPGDLEDFAARIQPGEPPLADGMVRLYRGQPSPRPATRDDARQVIASRWFDEGEEWDLSKIPDLEFYVDELIDGDGFGRWFSLHRSYAEDFARYAKSEGNEAHVLFIDVPESKLNEWSALKQVGQYQNRQALDFSRGEFVIPMDVLAEAKVLPPPNGLQRLGQRLHPEHGDLAYDWLQVKDLPLWKAQPGGEAFTAGGLRWEPFDHGDVGEMAQRLVSSRASYDALLGRTEKEVLGEIRNTGNWKSMVPGAPGYEAEWAKRLNLQIGHTSNPVARMMLEGKTDKAIAEWLYKSEDGMAYLSRMDDVRRQLTRDVPLDLVASKVGDDIFQRTRNWLRDVREQVMKYTAGGDPRIINATLQGTVNEKMLSRVDVHLRPIIHGEELEQIIGGSRLKKSFLETIDSLYGRIGTLPTDKLLREPLAAAVFKAEVRRRAELLASQKDFFTQADIDRIRAQARRHTVKQVKELMFDFADKGRFEDMTRFISPFLGAWQEAFSRWAGIVAQDPHIIGRARQVWNAPNVAGGAFGVDQYTDDQGNDYVTVAIPDAARRVPWIKKALADAPNLMFSKRNLNMITEGPGFGFLVTLPVNQMVKGRPEWEESVRFVLPYGSGDVWDQVLPSAGRRAKSLLTKEDDRAYATAMMRFWQIETTKYEFNEREEMPTEAEIKKMTDRFFMLRMIAGGTLPTQPLFPSPYQPYLDILRQYREENAMTADERFIADFGEKYYALTQNVTKSNIGIAPTMEAWEAAKEHEPLVAKFPDLASLIIGPDAREGAFNRAVYNAQRATPLEEGSDTMQRESVSFSEWDDNAMVKLGWMEYSRLMEAIDAIRVQMGLPNYQVKAAEPLAAAKRAVVAALRQKYVVTDEFGNVKEAWYEDYAVKDFAAAPRRMAGLYELVNNPAFDERPDIQALKVYLAGREAFVQELQQRANTGGAGTITAGSNMDLAHAWEMFALTLVERQPQFAELFNRYLDRDRPAASDPINLYPKDVALVNG